MINIVKKLVRREIYGGKLKNMDLFLRNKVDRCVICKKILNKDFVKKSFGTFCNSCAITGLAIMGKYPVTGEYNYLQYFW